MIPDDKDIDLEPSEWSSVDKPPPFWGRNAKHFFILLALGLILYYPVRFTASAIIRPLFR